MVGMTRQIPSRVSNSSVFLNARPFNKPNRSSWYRCCPSSQS
jgi:hypothetical protein